MSQVPTRKTLAKAVAVFGGTQAFTVLAALVRTKVAAYTIGPAGVGLNALYTTITNLVSVLMGCGLSNSSVPTLSQADAADRQKRIATLRLLGVMLAVLSVPVTMVVALCYSTEAMWLAPGVAMMVMSGIEMAVMKSLNATRALASSIMAAAVVSVVCTVPFFIWLGREGVIWAVLFTSFASSAITCLLGYRCCPVVPDFTALNRNLWRQVRPMFVLGFAFLLSGVIAQATDLLLQSYLASRASLTMVGFYKAGFQLAIVYTGMVFTAISNDFYPRLSAVVDDVNGRNALITRQVEVLLAMIVPLITVFFVLVPWIIPLLFSEEFLPIVPMVRVAALSVVVKAVYLPVGFLPVAMGKSWHFLLLESVSWAVMALGVIVGYESGGLLGVGYGLLLSTLFDLVFVVAFCHNCYHYRFKR